MGQFESKPEAPDEWAGLPSEPLDLTHSTDLASVVDAADAVTLGLGERLDSIVIPAAPALTEGEEPASAEPDGDA